MLLYSGVQPQLALSAPQPGHSQGTRLGQLFVAQDSKIIVLCHLVLRVSNIMILYIFLGFFSKCKSKYSLCSSTLAASGSVVIKFENAFDTVNKIDSFKMVNPSSKLTTYALPKTLNEKIRHMRRKDLQSINLIKGFVF